MSAPLLYSWLPLVLIAAWPIAFQAAPPRVPPGCDRWQACRDEALSAAAREDYELFHDLAWRAVQKGPTNDPALMAMLARAQSLSGRPHDALVMLQRLAALGIVTDAADSDDFRRVRALEGWPDFAARVANLSDPRSAPAAAPPPARPASATPPAPADATARKDDDEVVVGNAADALRFATDAFTPAGLAYDAVSQRFIVADRSGQKLSVIGERSGRMSNFVGAESVGFGEIGAIALDARQGDLWVATTNRDEEIGARLHKLQLISGRLLFTARLPAGGPPARFGDIVLTPQGAVLALDTLGGRIFRLPPGTLEAAGLELAAAADLAAPASIAPSSGSIVYVAHADGISRLDLQTKALRQVTAHDNAALAGFEWIRWHRARLIGIQRTDGGAYRIARIRLDSTGTTADRIQVLERNVSLPAPASAVIAGDILYYVTAAAGSSDPLEGVVRKITVR